MSAALVQPVATDADTGTMCATAGTGPRVRFSTLIELSSGRTVASRTHLADAARPRWRLDLVPAHQRRGWTAEVAGHTVSAVVDSIFAAWTRSLHRRARARLVLAALDVFAPASGPPAGSHERRFWEEAFTALLDHHGIRPYELVVEIPAGDLVAGRRAVAALEPLTAAGLLPALAGYGAGSTEPPPGAYGLGAGTIVGLDPLLVADDDPYRRRAICHRVVEPLHREGHLTLLDPVSEVGVLETLFETGVCWAGGPLFDWHVGVAA